MLQHVCCLVHPQPFTANFVCVAQAPAPSAALPAVQRTPLEALLDVVRNMFPDNVAAAAVDMNILGIITFSLFFGLCLSAVGEAAEPMIKLVNVSMGEPACN